MEFSGAASSGGMYWVNTIAVRLWPGRLIFSVGQERALTHPTMRPAGLVVCGPQPPYVWEQVGTGINANITEVLRHGRARLGHRH